MFQELVRDIKRSLIAKVIVCKFDRISRSILDFVNMMELFQQYNVELAHVDGEIEKLLDSLTGANNVLLSYVNVKIAELDGRKQELLAKIAELAV